MKNSILYSLFFTLIFGSIDMYAQCDLDWSFEYYNDGGSCKSVLVEVNGLTGDCEDCVLNSYTLSLEDIDQAIATYYTVPANTPVLEPLYEFSYGPGFGDEAPEVSAAPPGQLIGDGEILDFTYFGLYTGPLCINVTMECGSTTQVMQFCKDVELGCL